MMTRNEYTIDESECINPYEEEIEECEDLFETLYFINVKSIGWWDSSDNKTGFKNFTTFLFKLEDVIKKNNKYKKIPVNILKFKRYFYKNRGSFL